MTRKGLISKLVAAACKLYDEQEAASIAYMLAEKLFGLKRIDIALEPDVGVEMPDNLDCILSDLERGRPVQYIIGEAEFRGKCFAVQEGVLIPRQETEELVEWVKQDNIDLGRINILDIGTGSGAIAVSLTAEIKESLVAAIDISDDSLRIAKMNAVKNGVDIDFKQLDILDENSVELFLRGNGPYDIIVSNPPYVPKSDLSSMHTNVREYEPHLALFVPDDDALRFYRAIARHGRRLLKSRGLLYFEIYENFGNEMIHMLERDGYTDVVLRKDIHGKDRMIRCRKKS